MNSIKVSLCRVIHGLSAAAGLTMLAASSWAADPLLTSWQTNSAAQYARVYATTNARANGNSVTTWTNQSLPSYSDIQVVSYSASWVYVQYSGLSSHIMGPWLTPNGQVFQFWPTNQHGLRRFPRSPVAQTGNKDSTPGGYSGIFVNGVAIFNALDGQAWNGSAIAGQAPHTSLAYYWHRNAPVAEAFNFDYANGHQPPSAVYHTHQNPLALRYQLGDHVNYNASTKAYTENTNAVTQHSPIVGWAHDGYPVYGPYGYSVTNNAASGVRRMVAGYAKRDGTGGTDNLSTNLAILPAWYARFRQKLGEGYSTTAQTNRASINATYPLGTFAEDWAYLGDLGKIQGVDFDLDQYNGRWCVTPEYPSGTYAYFTAIDASGSSTYPYVFAYEFYGDTAGAGSVANISESVTTYFMGGQNTSVRLNTPSVDATNSTVTLVWSSVEGGAYLVETSPNQSTWTTQIASVAGKAGSTTTNFTGSNGTSFARVSRTTLASYDTVYSGGTSTQTDTQSYTISQPGTAGTNAIVAQSGIYGTAFNFTFDTDAFTGLTEPASYTASGMPSGISFTSGTRTFSGTPTQSGAFTVSIVAADSSAPTVSLTNSFSLTVNQAPLTVTADSFMRAYGDANPAFTVIYAGFVNGETLGTSDITGAPALTTTAISSSPAGSYPIICAAGTLASANYTMNFVNGTLTVTNSGSITNTNALPVDILTASWLTNSSGQYVRLYADNAAKLAGTSLTTWTMTAINGTNVSGAQALPIYSGVQEIFSSSNFVYIRSSGMPGQTLGPLLGYSPGPLILPTNQHALFRFPRTASVPATKTTTPGGAIGYMVDGTQMFDIRDALSWNGTTESTGTGYWARDAYVNEGYGFDPVQGHSSPSGAYHYHANPMGLRYRLGDHVDFNAATKTYTESTNTVVRHSPILGWVADGNPVYGPYGFASATNPASGVRRMLSGFVLRNGQNGTANLVTAGRTNIPPWAQRIYGIATATGPSNFSTYPLGRYLEDHDWMGDLINPSTSQAYARGVDYDLDEYDGRFCVTPEFPNGTYAYFVTITSNGAPVFPYYIGRAYYGSPSGGSVNNLAEPVMTNFVGGTNATLKMATPVVGNNSITLQWSAVDGGSYVVQSSDDLSTWTASASVSVAGIAGSVTNALTVSNRFYRTILTNVAGYDAVNNSTGGGGGTNAVAPGGSASRGTTVTITITLPTTPPQPPANQVPASVTLAGTISGTAISRPSQGTVVATFTIPGNAPTGAQNIVVTFSPNPAYTMTGAFTIN